MAMRASPNPKAARTRTAAAMMRSTAGTVETIAGLLGPSLILA
jgi:hypothetical protein